MNIIPFRPSEKYVLLQLVPYLLLIGTAMTVHWCCHNLFFGLVALLLCGASLARLAHFASVTYILTPHGLIVSRGLFIKHIYWRPVKALCDMRRERPGLLRWFDLVHVRLGVTGPPANRLTLYGIDDHVLYYVLSELSAVLGEQLSFLEKFELVPKAS